MTQFLDVLGGLSAEQFLTEYWQKKPLLVRQALPELNGMFEPSDIQELALEPYISARLISQHGPQHQQWQVKNSPLTPEDFEHLPTYWTLLVQAVDHYSFELAELWKKFDFIPKWRRDDIMVSYAPKGGSVGQHFDFYDVFLVQGYGKRRWQLGQWCDENTAFLAHQPLKLLPEMHVNFDEVLSTGDLLYVPPGLSHYGVAEDECLTFSFGFRMPNPAQLMDHLSDGFADFTPMKTPIVDTIRQHPQATGEICSTEFAMLKQTLIENIQNHDIFEQAVMTLASEVKYPDDLPENEPLSPEDLIDYCQQGYTLMVEPANRLLYRILANNQLEFWANGEQLSLQPHSQSYFKKLADGESLPLQSLTLDGNTQLDFLNALNQSILTLVESE